MKKGISRGSGGCFTNVSRALQNDLAKIYNVRNNISVENFELKLCTRAQSMALGTRTKFELEILIKSTILVIYKFRGNVLESSRNASETPPGGCCNVKYPSEAHLKFTSRQISFLIISTWVVETFVICFHRTRQSLPCAVQSLKRYDNREIIRGQKRLCEIFKMSFGQVSYITTTRWK